MLARLNADVRRDLVVATLLAGVLTLGWTLSGWHDLARLRLPDTDDAMRLQQIRDWLGDQRFADVTQHRLGDPPGLAMHWSRLADLVPATIVKLLQPLVGHHGADLTAVIAWPGLLFAAMIALTASITRRLGAPGAIGAVIAALAYPATTVFMPGRIDHHGLQLVLLLIAVRATIATGSHTSGVVVGIATACALAIGLEHAPLFAMIGAAFVAQWAYGTGQAQARLTGYAVALFGALALGAWLLRPLGWTYPACDGFTATFWRAAQLAASAPLVLALAGQRLRGVSLRLLAAAVAGAIGIGAAFAVSPACLSPYGAVDPLLARLWLANVAEAQPLLAAPVPLALGYAGLAVAGCIASVMQVARRRDAAWAIVGALQGAALMMTLVQLRGAYAAAALGVPALAAMVAAARMRGIAFAVPAWLASAGLTYPLVGDALARSGPNGATASCSRNAILDRLAALPRGRVLAPIDLGAHIVAATPHAVVAAPYHRNTAGNRALYASFLGTPDQARRIIQTWRVTYVVDCPGNFAELGAPPPTSLLAALRRGRPPSWLRPLGGGHVLLVTTGGRR